MKTNKRKASPSVLIVLIVAIVLVVSVTLAAIFRQTISIKRLFSVSNLSAQCVVTFDGVTDMSSYTQEYGVLASVDPTAPNYIGKLRASVQYKGRGVGLIRVRMIEEWGTSEYETVNETQVETERTVLPFQIKIPYTFPEGKVYTSSTDSGNQSKWYDNRATDYCYYYATPVYSSVGGTSTIPMITGVDTSKIDLGILSLSTTVHVMVETDVVQVNRYPQYWGINSLPWNSAKSASTAMANGVYSGEDVSLPAD